jgi:hypothetical protein
VIRFAPWRENFEIDRAIAEYSSADLPIPRVVEIGEAYGCHCAVSAMPEWRHLVHSDLLYSDLLYGNALVADGRVSAVFDWGCAMLGDFLYDLAWLSFFAPWFRGLDAVDVRGSALAHFEDIGLAVPGFDARMRCYEAHVGLASQAYQALIGDWDELARTARRTGTVLRG